MYKDICRSIIIYNKLIPPKTCGRDDTDVKIDYVVLGDYDAIRIESSHHSRIYKGMKETLEKEVQNLWGEYNPQILSCFRSDTEESIMQDDIFWKEKKLFLFLTTIHVNHKNMMQISELKKFLEEKINNGELIGKKTNVNAICYLTLENNDLILCMKSNDYKCMASITNALNRADKIKIDTDKQISIEYMYTIIALNLEQIDFIKKNGGTDIAQNVDRLVISCVVNDNVAFEDLKAKIKTILDDGHSTYQVLGNADYNITFDEVGWERIIYLFGKGDILNIENEIYQKAVFSVNTQIYMKADELFKGYDDFFVVGLKDSQLTEIVENEIKRLDQKQRKSNLSIVGSEEYKIFKHMLNTLTQFERAPFSKYIFSSVFPSLCKVLNHPELFKDDEDNVDKYILGIERLMQTVSTGSQHFFQIPDFSMYSCDIPIKLSAFYSAFATLIREYLLYFSQKHPKKIANEDGSNIESLQNNDYSFLVVPSIESGEQTRVIFHKQQPGDRILVIELPEMQMFQFAHSCRIITHEVSHYIGGQVRNREKRYKALLNIIPIAMVYYVVILGSKTTDKLSDFFVEPQNNQMDLNQLESLEKNIKNFLRTHMSNIDSIDKWYKKLEYDKSDKSLRYYLTFLEEGFKSGLESIIDSGDNTLIFSSIFDVWAKKNIQVNKRYENWMQIHKFDRAKKQFYKLAHSSKLSINNILVQLLMVASESYADLSMILALDLKMDEYFCLVANVLDISDAEVAYEENTLGIYRVFYVYTIMQKKRDEWSMKKIMKYFEKEYNNEEDLEKRKIVNLVIQIMNIYKKTMGISQYDVLLEKKFESRVLIAILEDTEIRQQYVDYLETCYEEFQNIRDVKKLELINLEKNIRDVHKQLTSEENIECCIQNMIKIISENINLSIRI